ncbi:MAG: hypothetical protein NC098_00530 [Lachnoclostridium sp.]|nr:hypothetical protein [Lachnoclostridium sp.]
MREYELAVSHAYYNETIEKIQNSFPPDIADRLCSAVFAYVTGGDELECITTKMEWFIFKLIREDLLKAIERSRKARQPRKVKEETPEVENVENDEIEGGDGKKAPRRKRKRQRRVVPKSIQLLYKMMDQINVPEEERDPNWMRYVRFKDCTW